MSHPIQAVELANSLLTKPSTTNQGGVGADAGVPFASLLPAPGAAAPGSPDDQILAAPGNRLPGDGLTPLAEALQRTFAAPGTSLASPAANNAVTAVASQADQYRPALPGQQPPLPQTAVPQHLPAHGPAFTGLGVQPGQLQAPEAEVNSPTLAQVARTTDVSTALPVVAPLPLRAADRPDETDSLSPAPAVAQDQSTPTPTPTADRPPALLTVASEQSMPPADAPQAAFARSSESVPGQLPHAATPADPGVESPIPLYPASTLQPVPVETPVDRASAAQQTVETLMHQAKSPQARTVETPIDPSAAAQPRPAGMLQDAPGVAGEVLQRNDVPVAAAGAKQAPADEVDRMTTLREPVSSASRQALMSMLAGQEGGGGLKQSMQGQGENPSGTTGLTAMTRAEGNLLSFLQNLQEAGPSALPSARVQVPVGQPGWGREVGQQLALFVSQDVSAARMRLNPQHLGPMEMQISLDGDKANVSFISQHAVVRDALESSLPRLREMLAESGLNLVNVNVSQQGTADQQGHGRTGVQQGMEFLREGPQADPENIDEEKPQVNVVLSGLIDAYA